jgi:hypothetical protein
LMIDLSSQGHSIGLFYQAQRGVSIFLTANQGDPFRETQSPFCISAKTWCFRAAAPEGFGVIDSEIFKVESEDSSLGEGMDDLGISQKALGGDAAPVQAYAAQVFLFDERRP